MKKILNYKNITIIVLLLVFLLTLSLGVRKISFAEGTQDDVYFTGYSTPENLYSETNTYAYNQTAYSYDLSPSGKIQNAQVSDEAPLITVLTHGLGGNASHWSNINGKFAPDSTSIISTLNSQYKQMSGQDANIYWAKVGDDSKNVENSENLEDSEKYKFKLIPLTQENIVDGTYNSKGTTIKRIEDVSKHIIIVYESNNAQGYNDTVYAEFNYVLSKIVYDVKYLTGYLPKINLIGHSRGGITNLQYALDHPDLVHSMFAIGTPFFGSSIAETSLAEEYGSIGREDIINREKYLGYYNRWINGKEDYYSNIKSYAIGGYSDTDFVLQRVIEGPNYYGIPTELLIKFKQLLRDEVFTSIATTAADWAKKLMPYLKDYDYHIINLTDLIITLLSDVENQQSSSLWDTFMEFFRREQCPIYKSDLLVQLTSQLGQDTYSNQYRDYGFIKYKKQFRDSNCNINKKADYSSAAVVHNLETRDRDIINYIVSKTEMGGQRDNSYFEYVVDVNNEVTITGLRDANPDNGVIIPDTIHGKPVVEVGYRAFEGKSFTSASLSSSLERIGDFAFADNSSLTNVTYSQDIALYKIGLGAFEGCSNLIQFGNLNTKLVLPNSIGRVEAFSFSKTGFLTVGIMPNVTGICAGAFAFCPNLQMFQMPQYNGNIRVINGVLYDVNGTLLAYPMAKTGNTYNTADVAEFTVNCIDAYAFAGNKNITSIIAPQVRFVKDSAFSGCENLNTLNLPELENASLNAFDQTLIDLTDDEFEIIGKTLLKYNGTESIINKQDLLGVETISSFAFANNSYIQEIYLPNSVERINNFAFEDSLNLVKLQFEDMILPFVYGETFFGVTDSFSVYLRKNVIDSLEVSDENWYANREILLPITTQAHFVDIDQTIEFYYGSQITVPEINVSGKYNVGWQECDEEGNILGEENLYNKVWNETTSQVYYKANLIDIAEYVLYFKNGSQNVGAVYINTGDVYSFDKLTYTLNGITYNYINSVEMSNCALDGYYGPQINNGVAIANFVGWYINDIQITSGVWGNAYSSMILELNAFWEPIPFTLTLINEMGEDTEQIVYYNSVVVLENFEDINNKRFITWVDSEGNSYLEITAFIQDKTLTAVWENVYTIQLVSDQYTIQTIIMRGVSGESFILPEFISNTHAVIKWGEYPVGDEYIIVGNESLYAEYEPRVFYISYNNLNFSNKTAMVLWDNDTSLFAPTEYIYGQGFEITRASAFFYQDYPTEPTFKFLGWYSSMDFTTEITSISTTQYGDVTVYAKWRYDYGYGASTGTQTITTESQLNQNYMLISLGLSSDNLYQNLLDIGITKLVISFKINIQSSLFNVGQEVYLYGGEDGTTLLQKYELSGYKNGVVTINMVVDLETLGANSFVIVRFRSKNGKWTKAGTYYESMYCVALSDKDSPEFTWSYQDPF